MKLKKQKYKVPLIKNTFINERATKNALANFIKKSDFLSMGKYCGKFEEEFALLQERKHAVLFNSGGSANLALIQVLMNLGKLKRGDCVGFSSLTWSTNVMPLIQLGLTAIPIDCVLNTLNIEAVEAIKILVKNKCKAFFVTNVVGLAGNLDKLKKLCKTKNIILIEDNCESLGTELHDGKTGNFGLASTFSFFVAHHMSTVEGGMVTTDNDEMAEMLKIVRANGWDRNICPYRQKYWRKKHKVDDFYARYTFFDLGYNLRPTEITGFLGKYQLPFLNKTIDTRERHFHKIQKVVNDNPHFIPLEYGHIKRISSFVLPFICRSRSIRDMYVKKFENAGIETRPVIAGNMTRQPFFRKYMTKHHKLPETDFIHNCGFYCGNSPDYTNKELRVIIDCIKKS